MTVLFGKLYIYSLYVSCWLHAHLFVTQIHGCKLDLSSYLTRHIMYTSHSTHTHTHILYIYIYISYICYICIYICIHEYVCVCIYVCICICKWYAYTFTPTNPAFGIPFQAPVGRLSHPGAHVGAAVATRCGVCRTSRIAMPVMFSRIPSMSKCIGNFSLLFQPMKLI